MAVNAIGMCLPVVCFANRQLKHNIQASLSSKLAGSRYWERIPEDCSRRINENSNIAASGIKNNQQFKNYN